MSPLVLFEDLVLFVKRLTVDGMYLVHNCENLQLPIQIQLFEKRKKISEILFHFWNLHQILNILKERMIVIANVFPNLGTVKILLRSLSKEDRFRTHLDSQHVKASQILV